MRKRHSQLGFIAYVLPLAGAACLLAGLIMGVYKAGFSTPSYILMGAGALLFLTIFIRAERVNLMYYLHVVCYSLLVGGICVGLYLFARQYNNQVDLTKQKLHSLSDATRNYLKGLDKPVTITIFLANSGPFQPVERLYNSQTDKLTWRYIDPVKNPMVARALDERVNPGDIYVQCGDNKQKLSIAELPQDFIQMPVVAENTFTNAIMQVTRKSKPKLCFLTGHGEVLFNAPAASGSEERRPPSLEGLRSALEKRGIQTTELDLARQGSLPDDATVVVLAGPKRDLFDAEYKTLSAFLKRGGKMLVLIDPQLSSMVSPLDNVKKLIGDWGVEAPDDLIVDTLGITLGFNPPIYPLMMAFDPRHAITKNLVDSGRPPIPAPTRPLTKGNVTADMQLTELVKSSPDSWSVPIDQLSEKLTPPARMLWKAQAIGVAVGKLPPPRLPGFPTPIESKNNTRLAVFGSSAIISDSFLKGNNTGILLMFNAMDWLTESEDMIAIPPRQVEGTPIILNAGQGRVIFMMAVILLPALLFFGGLSYTILRRRR